MTIDNFFISCIIITATMVIGKQESRPKLWNKEIKKTQLVCLEYHVPHFHK